MEDACAIPAAVTVFPGEIYRAPRSWCEQSYHKPHLLQRGRQGGVRGADGVERLLRAVEAGTAGAAKRVAHPPNLGTACLALGCFRLG